MNELPTAKPLVRRVQAPSPGFRRITFGGEALADFVRDSLDDHIKLILPGEAGAPPILHDYTPLDFNRAAQELTLDFALHAGGLASDWAAQAVPGQAATIAGPRGSFIIAADLRWHLLVGDQTALRAIARRLEELPSSTRPTVILQTDDPADRRPVHSAAALQVQWVDHGKALLRAVSELALGDGSESNPGANTAQTPATPGPPAKRTPWRACIASASRRKAHGLRRTSRGGLLEAWNLSAP